LSKEFSINSLVEYVNCKKVCKPVCKPVHKLVHKPPVHKKEVKDCQKDCKQKKYQPKYNPTVRFHGPLYPPKQLNGQKHCHSNTKNNCFDISKYNVCDDVCRSYIFLKGENVVVNGKKGVVDNTKTGSAIVRLDPECKKLEWQIVLPNLPGNRYTKLRFHGPADECSNADVTLDITCTLKEPEDCSCTQSNWTSKDSKKLCSEDICQVNKGLWYIQASTECNPCGQLRGQIVCGKTCAK
jgi:hypothetical protein